jgi:hypothetical protein
MSLCGAMSFGIASQPAAPVNQMKKELSGEKKQWAYVQKTLTSELQEAKTVVNKLHRVGAYGAGMVGGLAAAFIALGGMYFLKEHHLADIDVDGSKSIAFVVSCGLASPIFIASAVDKLLENKSGICLKTLTSFINKWPEHKAQSPQSLQGTFDGLYANRQIKNSGLTDKQAQQLIEGVLALSVAAQVA